MFVVQYAGPFGFIKVWSAVRDGETFSQQFLTPSIIEGIRQKLEVEKILRHKLSFNAVSKQQETVQSRGYKLSKQAPYGRSTGILTRGVLIAPVVWLGFESFQDAEKAFTQHICLCRNEDLLFPVELKESTNEDFNELDGFELLFESEPGEESLLVGFNRFNDRRPMYGKLVITGTPVKDFE